jgi:hypothetical protein
MKFGQRIFFLGYPWGFETRYEDQPEGRVPFIKSGVMSALVTEGGVKHLYLDGHNNPGFSGGPVVFNKEGDSRQPHFCGVIAGYPAEPQEVYKGDKLDPDLIAMANSGIVVATDIEHVAKAIDRHLAGS